jgi:hypothetical protein
MSTWFERARRRGSTRRRRSIRILAVAIAASAVVALAALVWLGGADGSGDAASSSGGVTAPLGSKLRFVHLASQHSNYCSLDRATVTGYPDEQRMQGACCDPMDLAKYQQQVAGLRQYASIPEIPKDPYDIETRLAKQLLGYNDTITLTGQNKATYDAAMQMTDDKAPCCCQCWRWYMTEGLAKFLIIQRHMPAERVAEITDLVNGCGGPPGSTPSPSNMPPPSS